MKAIVRTLGILAVTLILCSAVPVKALEPYAPYNYNSYDESVPTAAGYTVDQICNAASIGVDDLNHPADICYDGGRVYLLDSGNGRVLVLDSRLKLVKIIGHFTWKNKPTSLNNPKGIAARNGNILISDTDNNRVFECNEDGVISRVIGKPVAADGSDSGFFETLSFKPIKALFSGNTDIYVIVQDCYYGILRFSLDGSFHGFFGANFVETSIQQKADQIWKRMLTKEQRKYLSNYVPSDYASIDIDNQGFIYTAANKMTDSLREVQKLNNKGANILQTDQQVGLLNKKDYGDKEKLQYRNTYVDSKIVDISVSADGIIAALDQERNRVFFYDQDSNLLFITGGEGNQKGLFRMPCAIQYMGDDLLVLDSDKASITRLSPTKFGSLVLRATKFSAAGQYEKAMAPWHEVLQMDANFEAAYAGMGKALVAQEKYQPALQYLKLGNDKEGYSKAFKIVRNDELRNHFYWILAGLAGLIALVFLLKRVRAWVKQSVRVKLPITEEETPWYPMRHLINGFEGLRRTQNRSVLWVATGLVVVWFFVALFHRQYTGFVFNYDKAETLNIFLILARTAGMFLLWWLASLCVSSLLDGDGDWKHLYIVSAYALVPMMIAQILFIIFSNVATLEEQALLSWMVTVGYVWTGWLLFNGIREAHQFSGGRTLFCIFLTVVGMLLCVLMIVLFSSLVQQVVVFVMTVVNELLLR